MKRFRYVIAAVLLWLSITPQSFSFAETQSAVSAVVDNLTQIVNISGQLPVGSGTLVSVMVLDQFGKLDYIDNTSTYGDRQFSFSYKLDDAIKGTYQVSVKGNSMTDAIQTSFVYEPVGNVHVTGVMLNKTSLVITKGGGTQTLIAEVSPVNAANKAVAWGTTNNAVATVDANGTITPISQGSATITVTTADGSKTATCEVTVVGETSTSTTTSTSAPTPIPTPIPTNKGTYKVSAEQLANDRGGRVTIEVPGGVKELSLPSNTAELLGQNKLEVKSDMLVMTVPSELIKQLTSKLTAEELIDSSITLMLSTLSESAAKELIVNGQNADQTERKLIGDVYDFSLSIASASGRTEKLTHFDQPITIHFKVNSVINEKLAGVYYLADDGAIEYIGGQFIDGEMVAQISHFSKYAVLELTKTFVDVPDRHWASKVIQVLAAKQIVNGTGLTTFEPDRDVTRAEFVSLLVRSLKLTTKGEMSFTDVQPSAWYADAVSIAVKSGIAEGKDARTFDPIKPITREEMVVMLMRAYEIGNGKRTEASIASFTDEGQISSWAVDSVNHAAALHLVQGREAGIFNPTGITTRAEAAQIIYNLLFQ